MLRSSCSILHSTPFVTKDRRAARKAPAPPARSFSLTEVNGRAAHTAVWSGTEMVVWVGLTDTGGLCIAAGELMFKRGFESQAD